jgi:hypothetical protein
LIDNKGEEISRLKKMPENPRNKLSAKTEDNARLYMDLADDRKKIEELYDKLLNNN